MIVTKHDEHFIGISKYTKRYSGGGGVPPTYYANPIFTGAQQSVQRSPRVHETTFPAK